MQLNFDDTLKEPTVLPSRIPNLLVNGASGIAVGMATNMPPHNLSEVVDGMIAFIDNNDIEISELMKYIIAPDFPTGGYIYGYQGVKEAFETGRGRVVMRAKANIENDGSREKIVITEIPLFGQQSRTHHRDCGFGEGTKNRGHLPRQRRIGPRRHAHCRRSQERCQFQCLIETNSIK